MLPLDQLSDIALQTLRKRDITEEDLVVAVRLDLDLRSEFGEMWLAIDNAATKLYRISPAKDEVETFEFAHLVDPYVDNYMTTNRLLGYVYSESRPQKGDFENEDGYKEAMHKFRDGVSETIVLGNCTNTCKRKLFAFLTIWERLADGGEVKNDDPVFDQFNAKCPKCHRVYADQTRRVCKYCTNQRGTLARLLSYFKRYKLQLVTVIICLVLSSVIALINPLISGRFLFDQVITKASYKDDAGLLYIQQYNDGEAENPDGTVTPFAEGDLLRTDEDGYHFVYTGDRSDLVQQETGRHHNTNGLILGVGAIFGLAVLSLLISIVQNRCNAHMSTRVTCDMKNEIFSSMQHLSMSYFNKNPTGRLINAVNYDVAVIRNFYLGQIPALLVNLLNILGLTILLFTINWKLTLLVFAPVIPILILFKIFLPKLWHSYTKNWRRSSAMNSMLGDTLSGVRVVKAFAQEGEEASRFYRLTDRLYQAGLVINKYSIILWPVGTCITCLAFQAIWGFGGLEVMRTHMTYGEFNTFWGYIGMLYGPITFFSSFTNEMTNTINSAVRMFETLDTVPEICNAEEPVVLDKIEGEIKFDHVFFHYVPNRQILKDVCFEIKAGDHVGLVGHTGSGKSTVANLITRMYDVISGTIKIDGVDVRNIDIPSLRKNVAIVSQEIHLFYGTIADNIRYAKPDATMDEIIDAARKANAHDFILRLPEGYETRIGAGERSLSGGERQRIAIARALLLKPSLLILDEATAAMDTETERLISDAIDKLIVGRTTLTIAHRLSTLHNCNCIMAIENGELAEMGTIDELLAKKGVYYKLYTLQNEQMTKVMQGL